MEQDSANHLAKFIDKLSAKTRHTYSVVPNRINTGKSK